MIAKMPINRATIPGHGKSFSAAMTTATAIITNGLIMPSTVMIVIGAAQQKQQDTPCLQPNPKLDLSMRSNLC